MAEEPVNDSDEKALFQAAMQGVAPLPAANKVIDHNAETSPYPRKGQYLEQTAANDTLSDHIAVAMEAGDTWSYVRPGVSHQTLRRLRRGHWNIQENLDLHGYTRDEARRQLNAFLDFCVQKNLRCVRIIHGKGLGSKNREPILKTRTGNWLMQRMDVLAFCQAKPEDGGGGAVLVLLKATANSSL